MQLICHPTSPSMMMMITMIIKYIHTVQCVHYICLSSPIMCTVHLYCTNYVYGTICMYSTNYVYCTICVYCTIRVYKDCYFCRYSLFDNFTPHTHTHTHTHTKFEYTLFCAHCIVLYNV